MINNNGIIKNLKISKKAKVFVATFVLCASAFIGSGCSKKTEVLDEVTITEVLEDNKDNSKLDEILALNETCYIDEISSEAKIIGIRSDEKISTTRVSCDLVESILRLENYLSLESTIADLQLGDNTNYKDLDAESAKALQDLSVEDVIAMINNYQNTEMLDIERVRLEQQLVYLQNYYQVWVVNNGLSLSESLLKRTIKSSACQVSGLEPEYYNNCYICIPNTEAEIAEDDRNRVTVYDTVSGAEISYYFKWNSGIVYDTLDALCDIQIEETNYKKTAELCKNAFNCVKLYIQSGVELNKKNYFVPMIDENEALEQISAKVKAKTK